MSDKELEIGSKYTTNMGIPRFTHENISLPNLNDLIQFPTFSEDVMKSLNPEPIEIEPLPFADHMEKTEEYQKQSLLILQTISENTASLKTIVDLIGSSNENQEIILEILSDTLTIAKSKNKTEADTLFKKVFEKINSGVETAESMSKIAVWVTTFYTMVISNLPQ